MVILELEKVEIDYCPSCKGIWLDSGELELLSGSSTKNDKSILFNPAKDLKEKKYKCPICNKKMDKVEFGDSKVVIDKCKNDHGLWFDKGELNTLLSDKNFNHNHKVLHLLKNIFGE
jgi:Zn-finger nucleic acid-binding protein